MRITCHRIGCPPISTSGFGSSAVCSCSRVPRPPQRIATSICGRLPAWIATNGPRGRAPTRACEARSSTSCPARARRVLDLGCSTGWLAGALKERGEVEVVGIEREPAYAAEARERCDRVSRPTSRTSRGGLGRFDCLVAADVLEHLVDPWSALEAYVALLEPGCRAIVSLPNAAHWSTSRRSRAAPGRAGRGDPRRHAPALVHAARRDRAVRGRRAAVEHVERRPWLLWRGTRLDRHAGPLAPACRRSRSSTSLAARKVSRP